MLTVGKIFKIQLIHKHYSQNSQTFSGEHVMVVRNRQRN